MKCTLNIVIKGCVLKYTVLQLRCSIYSNRQDLVKILKTSFWIVHFLAMG